MKDWNLSEFQYLLSFMLSSAPPVPVHTGWHWGYSVGTGSPLQWRHNEHNGVSNHQPHDCLLNCLFRCRSKKTSTLRATGLCEGNSPVTGEFPAQSSSNAENVSIWWRYHALQLKVSSSEAWPLLSNRGETALAKCPTKVCSFILTFDWGQIVLNYNVWAVVVVGVGFKITKGVLPWLFPLVYISHSNRRPSTCWSHGATVK